MNLRKDHYRVDPGRKVEQSRGTCQRAAPRARVRARTGGPQVLKESAAQLSAEVEPTAKTRARARDVPRPTGRVGVPARSRSRTERKHTVQGRALPDFSNVSRTRRVCVCARARALTRPDAHKHKYNPERWITWHVGR